MTSDFAMLDRLPFELPEFTRLSWVNDDARAVWAPRFQRIGHAWREVEWRSVASCVRRCALTRLSHAEHVRGDAHWAEAGLVSRILGLEGRSGAAYSSRPQPIRPGESVVERVVIGRHNDVDTFAAASRAGDHDRIGALLGYPECCRRLFETVWINERMVDTTWAMAMATAVGRDDKPLEVDGPPAANILWRWMGVRAVPHLPCSFACTQTESFAGQLRDVGQALGFATEFEWIDEILSWPVEWSALHGIAEIKTPILRVSTRTDATARKYVVRRRGSDFPVLGADGLDFPYRRPRRRPMSQSAAFRRGIDNPAPTHDARPDWYHEDNGFSARQTMMRLHSPIVAMAKSALGERHGNVIDFGCGNGALLERLCDETDELAPFGIDLNPQAIAHARLLQPSYAPNFRRGDFFDARSWPTGNRFALGILMIGRLLEAGPQPRQGFIDEVGRLCDNLLVYAYPGYSDETFTRMVERAGLKLIHSEDYVGLVRTD